MSNFIKTMFNSAVSQVGRDAGKVVSNGIFGDAHSTPIRRVAGNAGGGYVNSQTGEVITDDELRERAMHDGFKPQYNSDNVFWVAVYIVFGMLASYLSFAVYLSDGNIVSFILLVPLLWIISKGCAKLFGNKIKMKKQVTVAKYVSDRQYRDGKRLAGTSIENVEIEVRGTSRELLFKRLVGVIYILISFLIILFGKYFAEYIISTTANSPQ